MDDNSNFKEIHIKLIFWYWNQSIQYFAMGPVKLKKNKDYGVKRTRDDIKNL